MHVDVVGDIEAFAALREDWDAVYAADPEAHLFVSWLWFERWLRRASDGWYVLAAKPSAESSNYVAFLPLRDVDRKWKDSWFYNEVQPAGVGFADFSGLLCRPEFEAEAMAAFGARLGQLVWARIVLDKIRISEHRLSLLLAALPADRVEIKRDDSYVERGIDLFKCPYAALPADWDDYLQRCLSANTRQKIRRLLRKIEGSAAYRVTHADAATVADDVETLLRFWAARWGERKGDRLEGILTSSRLMLTHCFERGALLLPILWREDRPLAALAILKDPQKKAMLFFMGGRDLAFDELPAAFALHAHSIRHAIAAGYETYDFLRGDEPYKYSFATDEHRLKRVLVVTRDRRNLGGKLLRRSLPYVFKRSYDLHEKGKLEEAEAGYRQMLEVEPNSVTALYGLGQILASRGDHASAVAAFRTLVAVKPSSHRGRFRLAVSLASLGDDAAAVEAFAEVVRQRPDHAAAYRRGADALLRMGRLAEALAMMRQGAAIPAVQGEAPTDWSDTVAALAAIAPAAREPHADALLALGEPFEAAGEFAHAIACYRLAIDANADAAVAHAGLARAFSALGRTAEAQACRRIAAQLAPRDAVPAFDAARSAER